MPITIDIDRLNEVSAFINTVCISSRVAIVLTG